MGDGLGVGDGVGVGDGEGLGVCGPAEVGATEVSVARGLGDVGIDASLGADPHPASASKAIEAASRLIFILKSWLWLRRTAAASG